MTKNLVAEAKRQQEQDTSGSRHAWKNENCENTGQAPQSVKNDALRILYTNADGLLSKRQDLKILIVFTARCYSSY